MGPTVKRPVQDPLAVVNLDNRLYMVTAEPIKLKNKSKLLLSKTFTNMNKLNFETNLVKFNCNFALVFYNFGKLRILVKKLF